MSEFRSPFVGHNLSVAEAINPSVEDRLRSIEAENSRLRLIIEGRSRAVWEGEVMDKIVNAVETIERVVGDAEHTLAPGTISSPLAAIRAEVNQLVSQLNAAFIAVGKSQATISALVAALELLLELDAEGCQPSDENIAQARAALKMARGES
jgi:hypothetical protein